MTDKEREIYLKVQKEYDMDDAEAIYEEMREYYYEDEEKALLPEKLDEGTLEVIVEEFRDNHDWNVADADALRSCVEDTIKDILSENE